MGKLYIICAGFDNLLTNLFLTVLPELAACDHLIRFWKEVSAKDDVSLCVIYSFNNNGIALLEYN